MGRTQQDGKQTGDGAKAGPAPGPDRHKAKRHDTPEERRAAVEAFERSGLTQSVFARQGALSRVTRGKWMRRHCMAGLAGECG